MKFPTTWLGLSVLLLLTIFLHNIHADLILYSDFIYCSKSAGQDCREDRDFLYVTSYKVTDESDLLDDFSALNSDITVIFNSSKDYILRRAEDWERRYKYYFYGEDVVIMSKIDHISTESVKFEGIGTVELFSINDQKVAVLAAVINGTTDKQMREEMVVIQKYLVSLQNEGYNCILALDIASKNIKVGRRFEVGEAQYLKVGIPRADNRRVFTYVQEDFLTRSFIQPEVETDDELTTIKFSMLCAVGNKFDCRANKESLKIFNFNANLLFSDLLNLGNTGEFGLPLETNLNLHMNEVAALLEATDADVILLQEVKDLKTLEIVALKMTTKKGLYKPYVMKGDIINVGMLTKISPELYPEEFLSIKGRSMLAKFNLGGRKVAIANVHFKSPKSDVSGEKRVQSIQEVLEMVQSMGTEYEIIVTGDFNTTNEEADMEEIFFAKGLYDPSVLFYSPEKTFTHFKASEELYLDLDHMFVTLSMLESVRGMVIYNGECQMRNNNVIEHICPGKENISDHFPMMVTFKLSNHSSKGRSQLDKYSFTREWNQVSKRANLNSDAADFIWSLYNYERDPQDLVNSMKVRKEFFQMFVSDKFGSEKVHNEYMVDFINHIKMKHGKDEGFQEYFTEVCMTAFSVMPGDFDDIKRLSLFESCIASVHGSVVKIIRSAEPEPKIMTQTDPTPVVQEAEEVNGSKLMVPPKKHYGKNRKNRKNRKKRNNKTPIPKQERNQYDPETEDRLYDLVALKKLIIQSFLNVGRTCKTDSALKYKGNEVSTDYLQDFVGNIKPMIDKLLSLTTFSEERKNFTESWDMILKVVKEIIDLNQTTIAFDQIKKFLPKVNGSLKLLKSFEPSSLVREIIDLAMEGFEKNRLDLVAYLTEHQTDQEFSLYSRRKYIICELRIALAKALLRGDMRFLESVWNQYMDAMSEWNLCKSEPFASSRLVEIINIYIDCTTDGDEQKLFNDKEALSSLLFVWADSLSVQEFIFSSSDNPFVYKKKARVILELKSVLKTLNSVMHAFGSYISEDLAHQINGIVETGGDDIFKGNNLDFYVKFLDACKDDPQLEGEQCIGTILTEIGVYFLAFSKKSSEPEKYDRIRDSLQRSATFVINNATLLPTDGIMGEVVEVVHEMDSLCSMRENEFRRHAMKIYKLSLRIICAGMQYRNFHEGKALDVTLIVKELIMGNIEDTELRAEFVSFVNFYLPVMEAYERYSPPRRMEWSIEFDALKKAYPKAILSYKLRKDLMTLERKITSQRRRT